MPLYTSTVATFHKLLNLKTVNILMCNTARNVCLVQAHSTKNTQLHFFVCLVFA